MLLNHQADPMASTKSGKTALSFAITFGQIKAAECLLQRDSTLIDFPDMGK